jgi:hypothetical protein
MQIYVRILTDFPQNKVAASYEQQYHEWKGISWSAERLSDSLILCFMLLQVIVKNENFLNKEELLL